MQKYSVIRKACLDLISCNTVGHKISCWFKKKIFSLTFSHNSLRQECRNPFYISAHLTCRDKLSLDDCKSNVEANTTAHSADAFHWLIRRLTWNLSGNLNNLPFTIIIKVPAKFRKQREVFESIDSITQLLPTLVTKVNVTGTLSSLQRAAVFYLNHVFWVELHFVLPQTNKPCRGT